MIEKNPKERFEEIKNLFNSSSFVSEFDGSIKVTKEFIEDFKYLIKLVDQMDKRNHIESINKIVRRKMMNKMEEKIKELKEKFEGSNRYMLTLTYEDIKELFEIIEILRIVR